MKRFIAVALAWCAAGCATGPTLQAVEPTPLAQLDPTTCPNLMTEGPLAVIYPVSAFEIGQQGWVRLRFDIDAEGSPANIRQMAASPAGIFDESARSMLEKTRFATPNRKDCEFVIDFKKSGAPK